MTLDSCLKALDGLQVAFRNSRDIELGLQGILDAKIPLPVLVRLADARGHDKIAMVGRRMLRALNEKERIDAQG